MKTYNDFKASSFTSIRQSWLGLLNIVMAMGSAWLWRASEDAAERDERANRFYERAVALSAKFSVRGPNLDVVQYLLLASQYLQGTQKSSQTWTLHGLAVKGAFAIGLHSNQASRQFTPLENEIRKRTWFGCILLDRVLSMTFGRPLCKKAHLLRLSIADNKIHSSHFGGLHQNATSRALARSLTRFSISRPSTAKHELLQCLCDTP